MHVLLVFDGFGTGGDLAVCLDLHDYLKASGVELDFALVRRSVIEDLVVGRLRQRNIAPTFVDALEDCKRLPCIQHQRCDVVHIHNSGEYLSFNTALHYRRVFKNCKIVVTLHGPVPLHVLKLGLKSKLSSILGSKLIDYFVVPSIHRARELAKTMLSPWKIRVIGNPIRSFVRLDKHTARSMLEVEPEIPVLLWLGRISREKRPEFVLSATPFLAERGVDPLFLYAGIEYEPISDYVLPAAEQFNAKIKYVGYLADPAIAYSAADAFVLTSEYENYPLALFEALSCGVPSAAPDLPIVQNELNLHPGLYVYRQGDRQSLAEALCQAIGHEDVDKKRISSETAAKFGYRTSGEMHLRLYDSLRKLQDGRN